MQNPAAAISPASFTNFGELLRYLRRRAELTQRELALQVGYHYSYMSRIENNEHFPEPALLMARFVPALGLEKEPEWTRRLLELAASGVQDPASTKAAELPEEISDPLPDLLPISLTPLLGRENDIAALVGSLTNPEVRLITLIGPPGVGKTRLGVQTAAQAAGTFAHGVKFIDLAPITDPNAFLPALAQNLDINEIPDVPLISRLAQALRQKRMLLVLDNFEQIVEAAAQVYQLLSTTPHLKLLVTSRVPLYIAGEFHFPVSPLSLPPESDQHASADLMTFAAVRLFVERARAVQPAFNLTQDNAADVVEICRNLDALPLAIELAAARVRTLPPSAMLRAFGNRFDWLAPNNREEQSSRQTLRGAIDWSYNLLSDKEQALFQRLSVFSARRTVDSVKAVCAGNEGDVLEVLLPEGEIFDLLLRLTDQSLLQAETYQEETRFTFLETIHEFSREKLAQSGESEVIKNRHLAYFCEMAERVEREVEFENQTDWLNRCEAELNNMRAALDWSLQDGAHSGLGIRLAASLGLFWYLHSHFMEGLSWSRMFLERARSSGDERSLAKLLYRTADLYMHQADLGSALDLSAEAVEYCRETGHKDLLAWALYVRGDVYLAAGELASAEAALLDGIAVCREIGYDAVEDISLLLLSTILLRKGDLDRAESAVSAGLALAEKLSDPWAVASGLGTLGEIRMRQKDYPEARVNLERSLAASRKGGDKIIIGHALLNLAVLTNLQGRPADSGRFAEEALGLFQQVGDETQQAYPLRLMGYASVREGNLVRARVLMRASLALNLALQNPAGQLSCLVGLACCAFAENDYHQSVRLAALVSRASERDNLQFPDPDEAALGEILEACRIHLPEEEFEQQVQQGEGLDLAEILSRLAE